MPSLSALSPVLLVEWSDPKALGALVVGLVLVGYLVVTLRREKASAPADPQTEGQPAYARPNLATGRGATLAELVATEEVDTTALLSRFVLNASGDTVGETVAINKDVVVLKKNGEFFAVDPACIIEKDGNLLADASIDWPEARRRGDTWRKESLDEIKYDDQGMPILNE